MYEAITGQWVIHGGVSADPNKATFSGNKRHHKYVSQSQRLMHRASEDEYASRTASNSELDPPQVTSLL
jgi:hypothetical protein